MSPNAAHTPRSSVWIANLLVALAISLIVNFSYLLLLIVEHRSDSEPKQQRTLAMPREGRLSIAPDGYGYILYEPAGSLPIDSVYVPAPRIRRLQLQQGDRLVVDLVAPQCNKAHYMIGEVKRRNGAPFDYKNLFNRPSETLDTIYQLLYYFLLAFVLLSILSVGRRHTASHFAIRCVWGIVAAVALYMFAPTTDWRTGAIMLNFHSKHLFDFILILKCSFTLVVAMLYGWIYRLGTQRQAMAVENERLKNENLITRYNMLVSQVNPHFFFNSLNSLAMLVREGHDNKALTYIDQLSYTFRYILQNGQNTLVTLDDELRFAEAYAYLFKIRYADKLFFDIEADPHYRSWVVPALTLQPLIDNAVKHNTITTQRPLHISIRTETGYLVVSNPIVPKLEPEPGTGIGLENLRKRWELITGHEIAIRNDGATFTVRLPLQKPASR